MLKNKWTLFIIINLMLFAAAAGTLITERVENIRSREIAIALQERQLALLEHNYQMYEENTALLSLVQEGQILIQPSGSTGALFTEIREMLGKNDLIEQEFYAREFVFHNINEVNVSEMRATMIATGTVPNISEFIYDMTSHHSYIKLDRILITYDNENSRLLLNITIYEEW
jgi:hypothetical protein